LLFVQSHSRFSIPAVFPIAAALIVLFGIRTGATQTVAPNQPPKRFVASTDVSLGISGQLTGTQIPIATLQDQFGVYTTQRTQGTSPSAGVVGTIHQSFNRWLGYNVNLGYTRFRESYSYGYAFVPAQTSTTKTFSQFAQGSVGTNMYETTIAYVVQGPTNKKFSTFAQFGGGGLWFLPFTHPEAYNKQIRLAMVFGVGLNYKLSEHLGIRAEYRGLFYKNPDFAYSLSLAPVSKMFTVTNEPTVSVTYTFGGKKKK
jgi:opacity protein-like surface antigen